MGYQMLPNAGPRDAALRAREPSRSRDEMVTRTTCTATSTRSHNAFHTAPSTGASNSSAALLPHGAILPLLSDLSSLACRDLSKKAIRSAMSACRHHAGKCCKCWCDVGSPRSRQTHILPTAVAARSHVLWWLSVSTLAIGVPIACANYTSIRRLLLLCLLRLFDGGRCSRLRRELLLFVGGRCSRPRRESRSLGSLLRSPL